VEGADLEVADGGDVAGFDPDVDGRRRQQRRVALQRLDGHLDRLLELFLGEASLLAVPSDARLQVRRVAVEPLADARRRVDRRVARFEDRRHLADVVDVWVRDQQVLDVAGGVAALREGVAEGGLAVRERGVDEHRLGPVDEVAGDVAGPPLDVELQPADALGAVPKLHRLVGCRRAV
jgi:hypothetical protein